MFTTIQEMKHFIRTTYGDSDASYQSTEEMKFHGNLQGNGAGPTIWALVTSETWSGRFFGPKIDGR
jgi:hypothetical protein